MAQILKDIEAIGKGRRNEQQGYSFRGVDDVYNMVHPLMSKHQVFCVPRMLAQDTSERVTTSGSTLRFVQLSMAYDFFAPDGSHVTAEVMGEAMDSGDKASNKAMSAAHKYALLQTFCIPTGDVPDADYTTQPEITSEKKQVSKSTAQKCPDCGGQMWDNRATKKGRQPDYKCKDKACNKAVWLDSEAKTEGFDPADEALRKELFDKAEWLMGKLPVEQRKEKLGKLVALATPDMAKAVSELTEKANAKSQPPDDPISTERRILIDQIKNATSKPKEAARFKEYMDQHYPEKGLATLDLDALTQINDDWCVPF